MKIDEDGFVCFSGRDYLKQLRLHSQEKGLLILSKIINILGERSAISQKLKQIITTTTKFYGTDQRIYIKVAGNKALGFIKVGEKKLFYHDYVKEDQFRLEALSNSCQLQSSIYTFIKVAKEMVLER